MVIKALSEGLTWVGIASDSFLLQEGPGSDGDGSSPNFVYVCMFDL